MIVNLIISIVIWIILVGSPDIPKQMYFNTVCKLPLLPSRKTSVLVRKEFPYYRRLVILDLKNCPLNIAISVIIMISIITMISIMIIITYHDHLSLVLALAMRESSC